MTGFGKATNIHDNVKISVEIKSLNSKQGDVNLRVPIKYKDKEILLRNALLNNLYRGKIDTTVTVEGDSETHVKLNKTLIKEYYQQLKEVAKDINYTLDEEPLMKIIMRMPDVVSTEIKTPDEQEWKVIESTIWQAVEQLNNFRQSEGVSLEKDIVKRVNNILALLDTVKPYEQERIERTRERIEQNLSDFVENKDIDRNRFEQEIIFYLEKYDITEEKVRLRKHCSYFLETIDEEEFAGKKLGFISQEMGREINTLGSKANNADIQKIVVQMKEELEKIKEQVLNIL